ncbi:hypothetical protein AGMMS4952_04350 [Spirochaetia bacterium]|nr:hypothetical protein AGMMS4952_04350 [Spirochaetia bacterium]
MVFTQAVIRCERGFESPRYTDIERWAIRPAANMQTRDGYGAGARRLSVPERSGKGTALVAETLPAGLEREGEII